MIGFVEFSYMSKYGHKDIVDEDFLEGFVLVHKYPVTREQDCLHGRVAQCTTHVHVS